MNRLERLLLTAVAMLAIGPALAAEPERSARPTGDTTFVRTESFPRPPYSSATYYRYERAGTPICTKLAVCNKFDVCESTYFAGLHRDEEDVRTGAPYGRTDAVPIARDQLGRHQCLVKFHLAGGIRARQ